MSQIFKKKNKINSISFHSATYLLPALELKRLILTLQTKIYIVHSKGIISSSKISLAKGQKAKKQMFIIVRKNDLFHGLAIES